MMPAMSIRPHPTQWGSRGISVC